MSDSGRPTGECTHGYRYGTCEICQLKAENAQLKAELQAIKETIEKPHKTWPEKTT